MPITGTFKGDFSNFVAAVETAEHALVDLEKGSGKAESSLNRLVDSFSGRKMIQDAVLAAEAVERIGGASKLTEDELTRLGAKAGEAAEKMRAMGIEVPTNLLNLEAAGRKTGGMFDSLGSDIVKMTASFFTAQAALDLITKAFGLATDAASAFATMVLEGSGVADVADNFERLASSIGLVGDELLGALRAGTQNTVRDFELMQVANGAMAAGLKLTADEFGTVAQGAFALAQATGGSVTDALKTMTDAMVTGRAKAIELRFGTVDLERAEDAYAAKLGRTREQLNEEQKAHADRIAIFEQVRAGVARLGEQQAGLDERVAQAQTTWFNFRDELGKSIATSPVLEAALKAIESELARAFGSDRSAQIAGITQVVMDLAIAATDVADVLVSAGAYIAKNWVAVETQFNMAKFALTGLAAAGAAVTGQTEQYVRFAAMAENAWKELESVAAKHERIDQTSTAAHEAIERIRTAMQNANTAATENATTTDRVTTAQQGANAAVTASAAGLGLYNTALDSNDEKLSVREERLKKMAAADEAALKELNKLADLHNAMEAALHGSTGASHAFTDAQLAEIDALTQLGFSTEQIAQRFGLLPVHIKQAQDALKLWGDQASATRALQTELDTTMAASTQTRVDQQLAQLQRWFDTTRQKMEENRTLTAENEAILVQLYQAKVDQIMGIDNALTENTRRSVEQRADIERNRLNDMIAHWDQWGEAAILEQEQVALAAEDAARNFGQPWTTTLDTVGGKHKDTVDAMATSFTQFGVLVTGASEGAAAAMSRSFMENGVLVVGAAADTARGIVDAHRSAAQEVVTTWSQAMDQVRAGQGEMSGAIPSGGPGTMTNYGEWGSPEHQAAIQKHFAQGRYFGPVVHRGENPAYPGYESAGANIIGPDWEALGMSVPPGGTSWAMLGGKENAYQMFHRTWMGNMARAKGGLVDEGMPYLVGEKGPELFVPGERGAILPNNMLTKADLRGAGITTNQHNTFNVNGTGHDVARIVSAELTRLMRQGRKWPAV